MLLMGDIKYVKPRHTVARGCEVVVVMGGGGVEVEGEESWKHMISYPAL